MMDMREIAVEDRTDKQHLKIMEVCHGGSVREYLLSMGKFKDVELEDEPEHKCHFCKDTKKLEIEGNMEICEEPEHKEDGWNLADERGKGMINWTTYDIKKYIRKVKKDIEDDWEYLKQDTQTGNIDLILDRRSGEL